MSESLYDAVGAQFFGDLVDAFYERVEADEVLRPMYPDDLTAARRHLTLFLTQYWGGGRVYEGERGHPRLRMRHAPFWIDEEARDAWLAAMGGAVDSLRDRLTDEQRDELLAYFDMAAHQLRNR